MSLAKGKQPQPGWVERWPSGSGGNKSQGDLCPVLRGQSYISGQHQRKRRDHRVLQ